MMLLEETHVAAQSGAVAHSPDAAPRALNLPRLAEELIPDAVTERRPSHEVRTFELPGSIWAGMAAAYAIFFGGITLATGHDGFTLFMLVIAGLYIVMFFGTTVALNAIDAHNRPSAPTEIYETWSGPLNYRSAAAQVLTVPLCFALFGIAIVIIRAVIL